MPTCDPLILTPACKEIIGLQPQSVLDIGVGLGKWGLLVREYAEVWRHHRLYRKDWQVYLLGVEIHARYSNPAWKVYDHVLGGDALTLPDWGPKNSHMRDQFDLCIMIDVLEHIPRDRALPLLAFLKEKCKHLLISYSNHEQAGVGDNPHEDHVSKWSPADFPWPKHLLAGDELTWALYRI